MSFPSLDPSTAAPPEQVEHSSLEPAGRAYSRDEAARIQLGFRDRTERQSVLEWLDRGLRPERPGRLQSEYPQIFDPASPAESITIFSESSPAAHAVLLPTRARIGGCALRVGLISLVFTDPNRRGQGLARQVVAAAIDRARERQLGLVLLWSDLGGLYRPLGFEQLGHESLLVVDRPLVERALAEAEAASNRTPDTAASAAQRLEITPAREQDWPAISALREARETGLELPRETLQRMAKIPGLDARVALRGGRLSAFAIRGRGDDLAEVIHDWGGPAQDVLACCRALLSDCTPHEELFLLAPPTREPVPWLLRRAGARVVRQPLAWLRVASPKALARDLAPLLPDLEPAEAEPDRLLAKLFGSPSAAASAAIRASDPGTGRSVELPLPLFVWGMESI